MIRQFFLAPLFATIAIAGLVFTSANAAPVSYTLPEETAAFKPGPKSRGGAEQLHVLPFPGLHRHPAARGRNSRKTSGRPK